MTATSATLILAAMTFLLAAAAFGTIVVNLRLHRSELRESEETAFRAAIVEQLDDCRHWRSSTPQRQPRAVGHLILRQPQFTSVGALLASVPLEQPCLSRLLARIAKLRDWSDQATSEIETGMPAEALFRDWGDEWHWQVTQRQEVVGLLLGAATSRGHKELVGSLQGYAALVPIPWKPSRTETNAGDVMQGALPQYPEGDAYRPWSPAAQDHWAQAIVSKQKAELAAGFQQMNPHDPGPFVPPTPQ